jgi:MOSC domain-containing protein YiiM
MTVVGTILTVQTGTVRLQPKGDGGSYRTALHKETVRGSVMATALGFEGDEQADKKHHGGTDKALCCFPVEHFSAIGEHVRAELPHGAFGENCTLQGMLEDGVCVGDRLRFGAALVEVSQPRQPCVNLARRWGRADLVKWLVERGFTGWYVRVLEGGLVEAPCGVQLVERAHPEWTIARLNGLMSARRPAPADLREAAALAALSEAWRAPFRERLARAG